MADVGAASALAGCRDARQNDGLKALLLRTSDYLSQHCGAVKVQSLGENRRELDTGRVSSVIERHEVWTMRAGVQAPASPAYPALQRQKIVTQTFS